MNHEMKRDLEKQLRLAGFSQQQAKHAVALASRVFQEGKVTGSHEGENNLDQSMDSPRTLKR